MKPKNNGEAVVQDTNAPKGKTAIQESIDEIKVKLSHFQKLENLVNQRRTLEAHLKQISENLEEMTSSKFIGEESRDEVSQIKIFNTSSRYDGYTIKNGNLLKETLEFLKSRFEVKLQELDSTILSM